MKFNFSQCIVIVLSTAISLFTPHVFAAYSGIVLGVGVSAGGDTVAEFSDGTSQDMGDGISIYTGYQYMLANDELTLHGTIGYSFDDPDAVNGYTEIKRVPIQLTISKDFDRHQIGMGIDIHKNVELTQRIYNYSSTELEFDDATGLALQYAYRIGDSGRLGLRYVDIEYETDTEVLDASHFGIFMDLVF